MRKRLYIPLGIIIILAAAVCGVVLYRSHESVASKPAVKVQTHPKTAPTTAAFDKTQLSLTDPASLWVIVNKQNPLQPLNYAPTDLRVPAVSLQAPGQEQMELRDPAATALEQLFAAATTAGYHLQVISGYRSYTYQVALYNGYVSKVGQSAADQESARPGYSEHQTGLAVDIGAETHQCNLEACFGTTPEGQWLDANAYHYGFLLRYPADKTDVTGYEYEPWHFRFIGLSLSQELHTQNVTTLEEFFNVPGGSTYK